jgi:hypothetical protein
LIFVFPTIAASARGLVLLADRVARRVVLAEAGGRVDTARSIFVGACLTAGFVIWGRDLLAPINPAFQGYREAGKWLSANTPADARVFDLKGWATFYGKRPGYSFGEIDQAKNDPKLGWLVAHDALLIGPWDYCEVVRKAVAGRTPVKSFPEQTRPGIAQVHVFDLSQKLARSDNSPSPRSSH